MTLDPQALTARITELEEALAPFARLAESYFYRYETRPGEWRESHENDPDAMRLARHLRVAQVIYDDGPDESDKAQADLHMSAAILLAKRIVPYGDTRVSDADAHEVINSAPRAHLTGGRNV